MYSLLVNYFVTTRTQDDKEHARSTFGAVEAHVSRVARRNALVILNYARTRKKKRQKKQNRVGPLVL